MGVVNLTPDSFSGDGIYRQPDVAAARAQHLVAEGADVIDVGGESTRPSAESVSLDEELERVLPALHAIVGRVPVPVSVDTSKAQVAARALEAGASMINDVSGLRDPDMGGEVASGEGWLVLVDHGSREGAGGTVAAVRANLERQIEKAEAAGVRRERLLVDPGFGFGKGWRENFELTRCLDELRSLRLPILVGPSRKGMIGQVLGVGVADRVEGSISLATLCIARGADVIRVHDVRSMKRVALIIDAIVRGK